MDKTSFILHTTLKIVHPIQWEKSLPREVCCSYDAFPLIKPLRTTYMYIKLRKNESKERTIFTKVFHSCDRLCREFLEHLITIAEHQLRMLLVLQTIKWVTCNTIDCCSLETLKWASARNYFNYDSCFKVHCSGPWHSDWGRHWENLKFKTYCKRFVLFKSLVQGSSPFSQISVIPGAPTGRGVG